MDSKIKGAYRAILEQETGVVKKDPGGRIKIVLAYPNTYYVGMSNLGLHTMYRYFNSRSDTLCERVFLPQKNLEALYRNSHTPLLTLESLKPIKEFDILAFSCSFENDYSNCLKMMDLAHLPLLAKERDEQYPLVIMGGPCTFFNVEPMASFIDCFLCGEGEGIACDFLDIVKEWLCSGGNKQELCQKLLGIEGVYLPQFYEYIYDSKGKISEIVIQSDAPGQIVPRIEKDIDTLNSSTVIFNQYSEFSHMYLLEVSRGCPRGCHFCLLSRIYKPFRTRDIKTLLISVQEGLRHRSTVGLIGGSLTDYQNLTELCEGILSLGGKVSLCSLRVDEFSDRFMECLAKSAIQTITLAPETGTEKLRASIGKADVTDEKIMNVIDQMIKWKIPNLKLYFMVGLPKETEEDVKAIARLVKNLRHHAYQLSKGRGYLKKITVSISSFIPKPLTPFQFYPMEPLESLNHKVRYLAKELNQLGGVACVHDIPKWSFIQALLARGDRKIGEILFSALKQEGNWDKAFRQLNINPEFYIYRSWEKGDIPPWTLWTKDIRE